MSVLDALANVAGSALQFLGVKETNKAQVGLGQDQMAFQERMSSTAYQRAMEDMRTAGLNPILAYSQGGASTPGGAMPVISNPYAGAANMFQSTASGIKDLAQADLADASAENQKAQAAATNKRIDSLLANDEAFRALNSEQQMQTREITWKVQNEVAKIGAEIKQLTASTGKTMSETDSIEFQNVYRSIVSDFFKSNEWAAIAKEMGPAAGQAAGIVQRVISSLFNFKRR